MSLDSESSLSPAQDNGADDLSDTIRDALEEQAGENIIGELASVSDDAPDTTGTEDKKLYSDDGGDVETPSGDGEGADQTPETKHAATDRELFFSLAPLARREALELLSVAEERRNYLAFLGTTPVGAFQVLLSADFMLRNGSPDQKIAIILQLLKDYDIDIEGLQGGIKIGHVPTRPVNRQ